MRCGRWLLFACAVVFWPACSTFDEYSPHTEVACTTDADCGVGGRCEEHFCRAIDALDELDCAACGANEVCCEGVCCAASACCDGSCADLESSGANCGVCGLACGAGEACVSGVCSCGSGAVCDNPEVCCDGACVNLAFDAGNCGTCGAACDEPLCVAGVCQCPAGTASCNAGQICETKVFEDPLHCGTCASSCGADQTSPDCIAGRCSCGGEACATGTDCCVVGEQKSCLDMQSSRYNCGACGTKCASGEDCVGGACSCVGGAACSAGTICCSDGTCQTSCACGATPDCADSCCSDLCVDTSSDRENCGACGNVCRADQSCSQGTCVCDSGTNCGDRCAELNTAEDHCGACGVVCGSGESCCDGTCVSTSSDSANCGSCGSACGGECAGGQCGCGGIVTDLATDASHCGSCGNDCDDRFPNSDVVCSDGRCLFLACVVPFANCDQDLTSNGCEVDLSIDTSNCGACAVDCQGGDCTSGVCGCGGTGNIDLQTNPLNCGSCGNVCSFAHAGASCVAGNCQQGACSVGYGECDAAAAGCETDLKVDGNCGACAVTCGAGEICANGCQPNTVFVQLVGGEEHTCARRADGVVFCWGAGKEGQLGNGSTNANFFTPQRVTDPNIDGHTIDIAAARQHTCAVVTGGDVYCWGSNNDGKLGIGNTTISRIPVPAKVQGLPMAATKVACGADFTCALLTNGAVFCWGSNWHDEMGNGSNDTVQLNPEPVSISNVTELCTGERSACALHADGSAECWGSNNDYRLGDDTNLNRSTPVFVKRLGPSGDIRGVTALSCYHRHVCALIPDESMVCWGWNINGQLGDGIGAPGMNGTKVINAIGGAQLGTGSRNSCNLANGNVKCWGSDLDGQIAHNFVNTPTPNDVGLSNMTVLGGGRQHSCASDGADIWCWGNNSSGQLGDDTTQRSALPKLVVWP